MSERVPEQNFYRKLKSVLDLNYLYRLTEPSYGATDQRSIDPIVFFKLWLVGYLENIIRDRKLHSTRIKSLESGDVRFVVREYRHGGKKSVLALFDAKFIRRFSMHILPKGFTRIRHYSTLSRTWKKEKLPRLQAELATIKMAPVKTI